MPDDARMFVDRQPTVAQTAQPARDGAPPPRGKVRLRLAAALASGALVTVLVGYLERALLTSPHPISYFHLFFSDTFYMKAWLASAALALACGQLITAAGMFGLLRIAPGSRIYAFAHRWSGRLAIALTLPVAFNCLFDLGLNPPDMRIMLHATFGAFIYGVFVAKVLLVRQRSTPGWLLALAGSALFAIILGLWATSAYWLFSLYGVHL